MRINGISGHTNFKGAYIVRGTDSEISEFNEEFFKNMKSRGHRAKYRMFYAGPRISPYQPQNDLFIATGTKDIVTLNEFIDEESKRTQQEVSKDNYTPSPEDAESDEFRYWYFKQTDKTIKNLREKFGTPIQIKTASSILRAIEKGQFDFMTGEKDDQHK